MVRSIASAPGKVILFGEHAVVYGVTAIAAALSDLRIVVILVRKTNKQFFYFPFSSHFFTFFTLDNDNDWIGYNC